MSAAHSPETDEAADELTRLYRLAWALCGSRRLAEDLTQETYARMLSQPRGIGAGGDFAALVRTLRRVLDDHWRSERPRPPNTERHDDGGEPAAVYAAVADLPGHLRDVVAAVDVAAMSYAEAAHALRVPPETVASRLHRARARLAWALGEAA